MNNNLPKFMNEYIPKINATLDEYLSGLKSYPILNEAMRYSVDAGGKRIRPLFLLAVIEGLGKRITQDDLKVAASLEMIHTYSLIHDDLPEMDNDDLRRGKPTNHKVYGQAIAVLAGDALLTNAFELVTQTNIKAEFKVILISNLARFAGAEGMVNGQVGDIQGEKKKLTLNQLKQVHFGKTAALLEYACLAGATLGKANVKQQQLLIEFGKNFGLAFQIYDDILDEVGSQEELGKKVHKDQVEHKNTYTVLLGLSGAKNELQKIIDQMNSILTNLNDLNVKVDLLAEFLNYFKINEG
ncbi:polyprenyl synthetase family protein [Ligilactobacillus sp. LYQ135]